MNPQRIAQLVALGLAVVAALAALFFPAYTIATSDSAGNQVETTQSIFEAHGPVFLAIVAVPVVFAAAPLVARGQAWRPVSITSVVLLGAFVLVGILSIGTFFIPAFVCALVALFLSPHFMEE